jgi:hypothetical protein
VKRVAVLVATVVGALLVAGLAVPFLRDGDPYAGLRQASAQTIPGALAYELVPPPADAHPELTPQQVERRYPADGGEVQIAFATVRDTLEGRSIGPGWVLFARGVCLRNAKGELVSDARGTDPNDLACTDATIWILAVDPTTAGPLVALTGYDPSGTWRADVAG